MKLFFIYLIAFFLETNFRNFSQMQICQLSRFPRDTPALETLIYLPHDF